MRKQTTFFVLIALMFGVLSSPVLGQVKEEVVNKIAAALPDAAPAKPGAKRIVLIFTKTNGFSTRLDTRSRQVAHDARRKGRVPIPLFTVKTRVLSNLIV